jgi:hypothetical protein
MTVALKPEAQQELYGPPVTIVSVTGIDDPGAIEPLGGEKFAVEFELLKPELVAVQFKLEEAFCELLNVRLHVHVALLPPGLHVH